MVCGRLMMAPNGEDVGVMDLGRGKMIVWERVGGLGDSQTFDTAHVIQTFSISLSGQIMLTHIHFPLI